MSLEVAVISRPPDGREFWNVLYRIVPRAMLPTLVTTRGRAPRGRTGKMANTLQISLRRVDQALVQGISAAIGSKVPYAHLVSAGHRIVPRGKARGRRLSKEERASRKADLGRRRIYSHGRVAGNPFADVTLREDMANIVRRIEKLLAQDKVTNGAT